MLTHQGFYAVKNLVTLWLWYAPIHLLINLSNFPRTRVMAVEATLSTKGIISEFSPRSKASSFCEELRRYGNNYPFRTNEMTLLRLISHIGGIVRLCGVLLGPW